MPEFSAPLSEGVLDLQADLQLLLMKFTREVTKRGGEQDPACRHVWRLLLALSDSVPLVSLPTVFYLAWVNRERKVQSPRPKSDNPELQAVIDRTLDAAYYRMAHYLTHATLTGGVLWLSLRLLPKQIAKREATEVVEMSAEPLDAIGRGALAHC